MDIQEYLDQKQGELNVPKEQPIARGYLRYRLRFSDMPKGVVFGDALSPKRIMIGNVVAYKDINYKVLAVHHSDDLKNNSLTVKAVA
jgi:hypothetical protein